MKSLILIIFSLFSLQISNAQIDGVVVNEILEHMSQGEKIGLEVALVDVEVKDANKSWKKFVKKHFKAKTKSSKKSKELFTDDAKISEISENTVDIFAIATKAQYGTRLTVYFDLGGDYVSSEYHPASYGAAERILKEFAVSQSIKIVDSELKTQKNSLSDLKKELKRLIKDKGSHLKEIEEAKALIAQRERDITDNIAAQEIKRQQIAIQEEILKTIKQKRAALEY